jgi:hypothetical protein
LRAARYDPHFAIRAEAALPVLVNERSPDRGSLKQLLQKI